MLGRCFAPDLDVSAVASSGGLRGFGCLKSKVMGGEKRAEAGEAFPQDGLSQKTVREMVSYP
jgi:hypothetical protein